MPSTAAESLLVTFEGCSWVVLAPGYLTSWLWLFSYLRQSEIVAGQGLITLCLLEISVIIYNHDNIFTTWIVF